MLRCAIFDMDGTLLDTERLSVPAWVQAGRVYGYTVPGDFMLPLLGSSTAHICETFLAAFGPDFPIEQVWKRRIQITRDFYERNPVPLKSGARELLAALKDMGVKLALATSTHREIAQLEMEKAQLWEYFDVTVTGDMVSAGKPDPEIFLLALRLADCGARESIVVEDSVNGTLAGAASGCRTILVPDLNRPDEATRAKAYRVLHSLDELIPLLPQL